MCQNFIKHVWTSPKPYCTQVYWEIWVGKGVMWHVVYKLRRFDHKEKSSERSMILHHWEDRS
uniref:Uncharacterized protein n=1 Tax=Vombatus ursinus TaxID=29139 RepID=A0A4X2L9P7_VOMUR